MNRQEVVYTIRYAGEKFSHVMSALSGKEYAAGYDRAIKDMIRLFQCSIIAPDYESERKDLLEKVSTLEMEKAGFVDRINEQARAIEFLLNQVDVCKVLAIKDVT